MYGMTAAGSLTLSLAVSAVLVVVLPQHAGQYRLVLLVQLLGLLPFRTGGHVCG